MSTKLTLPPELLGLVTEHIGGDSRKIDLLNLALVSRACRVEAQRALFRVMDEHSVGNSDGIMADIKTHNLFLDSILSSPERLGQIVRCYVCIDLATAPADSQCHTGSSFDRKYNRRLDRRIVKSRMHMWNKLCKALPLLTGLTHLTFVSNTLRRNGHSTNSVSILRRCHISLRSLVWGDPLDMPALASEFFPRQRGLRSFGFYRKCRPASSATNISMEVLPSLQDLKGDTNTIMSLLPRATVESISWTTDPEGLDLSEVVRVGPQLARTRYLCMSGSKGLNLISQYLGSVEKLCLKTRSDHWDPDFSNFNLLTSLRVLILQDRSAWDEPWYSDEHIKNWWLDTIQIIQAAFAACPTLHSVYVESFENAFYYSSINRVGDEFTPSDGIHLSEILAVFDPWMPFAITQPSDVHDYM